MEVFNRICDLRRQHAYTQTEMAHRMKISHSVFNRIENGTRPIRDDELKSIANIFNVSTDYLLGNEVEYKAPPLPQDESILLEKYRQLSDKGKMALMNIAEQMIPAQKK